MHITASNIIMDYFQILTKQYLGQELGDLIECDLDLKMTLTMVRSLKLTKIAVTKIFGQKNWWQNWHFDYFKTDLDLLYTLKKKLFVASDYDGS